MSSQNPNPEIPPRGWQPITNQTVFCAGEYYVLLTQAHEPFVTIWYPGDGLIPAGHGDGEFSGRGGANPRALYYCQLPEIPEAMFPEISGMVVDYVRDGRSGHLDEEARRAEAEGAAQEPEDGEP